MTQINANPAGDWDRFFVWFVIGIAFFGFIGSLLYSLSELTGLTRLAGVGIILVGGLRLLVPWEKSLWVAVNQAGRTRKVLAGRLVRAGTLLGAIVIVVVVLYSVGSFIGQTPTHPPTALCSSLPSTSRFRSSHGLLWLRARASI